MPPTEHHPYTIPQDRDDTLRIAYIGDSWAFMHREHDCKISTLLKDTIHRPVKVHSYGICGLTSKEFYENIFNNANLNHFLQKRRYEYCYISLGINDTYTKMSTAYYQESMEYIIRFFLANHVHPIIQEIPDYDIYKSFNKQVLSRKVLRNLSMLINKTPLDCKQLYRNALDEMILKKNYTKDVSIIRYQAWNKKGSKDWEVIYQYDGLHLNEKGYDILDSCIAETCMKHY
jgi:lysophospholipase L1-like esterase